MTYGPLSSGMFRPILKQVTARWSGVVTGVNPDEVGNPVRNPQDGAALIA